MCGRKIHIKQGKYYADAFFKVLLFCVYLAFFTVQLFFRYHSANSRQSIDGESYRKSTKGKPLGERVFIAGSESAGGKSSSYLNKRFQPEDHVILPRLDLRLNHFHTVIAVVTGARNERTIEAKRNITTLRGPPAV